MNEVSDEIKKRIELDFADWEKKQSGVSLAMPQYVKDAWMAGALHEAQVAANTLVIGLTIISRSDPISIGLDEVTTMAEKGLSAYQEYGHVED